MNYQKKKKKGYPTTTECTSFMDIHEPNSSNKTLKWNARNPAVTGLCLRLAVTKGFPADSG